MKRTLCYMMGLAVAASGAFATTKTVSQAGGADFTSIQAAIDSFTEAERSDGTPDEVVIMDSATYDEQVALGGLIPVEGQSAGYLTDVIEFNSTSADPFTLRGDDPDNRPVIAPTTGPSVAYGVFNGNPDDNFLAVLSFMGKDMTVANIEIRTDGSVGEYGANGQAGNMEFNNVLFGRMGSGQEGDSLLNLNNDVSLSDDGFDNSYTFVNCTWDGTVTETENFGSAGIYFHGYSGDDITNAGLTAAEVGTSFTFDGCNFINLSDSTRIRGRDQANEVTVTNSFMTGVENGFVAEGRGSFTISNSIFYENTDAEGAFGEDQAVIHTDGRSGATPELVVSNNLFVNNLSEIDFEDATGFQTRASVIRVENDGEDPSITFDGNTFVNNPIVFRFADSAARERNAVISNNIFQNSEVVLTASDGSEVSYLPPAEDTAPTLTVSGEGNVFDEVVTVVEESELLPNVSLEGDTSTVTFANDSIDPADPFSGPPYIPQNTEAGANLAQQSNVADFMLFD